jgi:hypothetical protein
VRPPSIASPPSPLRLAGLAALVALVQFRILAALFGADYHYSVEAAQGVLRGEPHWRMYQSRLLGPALIKAFEPVFESFALAHVFCTILLLAIAGFLTLWFLGRAEQPNRALVGYLTLVFIVTALFQKPWLYVWDFIDLIVFIVFNAFVARHRDVRLYAALVAVALLNRESALYLAGWMILDPLVRWIFDRRVGAAAAKIEWPMLATGVGLFGGGLLLIEGLRKALFVREIGPTLVGEVAGAHPGFHWMLADNLRALTTSLTSLRVSMSFLVPLAIVLYLAFAVRLAWRDPRGRLALAATHILLLLSTLCFGIVFETRVYMALVPLVAFQLGAHD